MSLTVSNNGTGGFTELEPGSYLARCIRLIDIGTQAGGEYQGKKVKDKKQVVIMWELPTEIIEEGDYAGNPRTISQFYTASTNEKAKLRKDLEAWRGKAFTQDEIDAFNLIGILGVPCMLSIGHKASGKAEVKSVSKVPKGMTCPPQILPSVAFDLSEWIAGNPEMNKVYADLSDGMRGMIDKSLEVKNGISGGSEDPGPQEGDEPAF